MDISDESPQALNRHINEAFHVATQTLPNKRAVPKQPWISQRTLDLISQRQQACSMGHLDLERELYKKVRRSAKEDRSNWLDEVAAAGDWESIRRLRKGIKPSQGRLKKYIGRVGQQRRQGRDVSRIFGNCPVEGPASHSLG